jgi:hypothetical protein
MVESSYDVDLNKSFVAHNISGHGIGAMNSCHQLSGIPQLETEDST